MAGRATVAVVAYIFGFGYTYHSRQWRCCRQAAFQARWLLSTVVTGGIAHSQEVLKSQINVIHHVYDNIHGQWIYLHMLCSHY